MPADSSTRQLAAILAADVVVQFVERNTTWGPSMKDKLLDGPRLVGLGD